MVVVLDGVGRTAGVGCGIGADSGVRAAADDGGVATGAVGVADGAEVAPGAGCGADGAPAVGVACFAEPGAECVSVMPMGMVLAAPPIAPKMRFAVVVEASNHRSL